MNIISIAWKTNCTIKKLIYKVCFRRRLVLKKKMNFRTNFHLWIEPNAFVSIGNSFFNNDCSITAHEEIIIGNNCLFGEGVRIYDHNHVFSNRNIPIVLQGFKSDKVTIGNDCWIGSNCTILKGSHIGDGCVIAAGQIIRGIIPPYTIVRNDGSFEMRH